MGRIEIDGGFWLQLALMLLLFPLRVLTGGLLAALIHECGHLIAIRLVRGSVLRVELHAGGARIVTGPMSPGQELFCALAGPVAGMMTLFAWQGFPELAAAGVVQTMFNLIPVYPLDGGRARRAARNICCKSGRFGVQ